MNFLQAVQTASRLAYEEDAMQVVGRINADYAIAHIEDTGRQCAMQGPLFRVTAAGLDAADTLATAANADLELDQDWNAGTTSFFLDGFRVTVDGPCVEITAD